MYQHEFFINAVIIPAGIVALIALFIYLLYYMVFGAHSPFSNKRFEYPAYISKQRLIFHWLLCGGILVSMAILYVSIVVLFSQQPNTEVIASDTPLFAVTTILSILLCAATYLTVIFFFVMAISVTARYRQQRKDIENHKLRMYLNYAVEENLTFDEATNKSVNAHQEQTNKIMHTIENMIHNNRVFHLSNSELFKILLLVSSHRPDLIDDVNRLYYKNFEEIANKTADPGYKIPEDHENYKSKEQVKKESADFKNAQPQPQPSENKASDELKSEKE